MAVLLALNLGSVLLSRPAGQPRVRVPFSPYFVNQLNAGQIRSISSTGDTIQGTFNSKQRFPSGDAEATPTTLFSTEIPTFWNKVELTHELQSKGVEVNARSTSTHTSPLAELLLGFGPTLLLVGLFILLARRAQRGGAGDWAGWGTSAARRRAGSIPHGSASRLPTWPGSTRPRPS